MYGEAVKKGFKKVFKLYEYLSNVKGEDYVREVINNAVISVQTSRDINQLQLVYRTVKFVGFGKTISFPRFWIDEQVVKAILTVPITKALIEEDVTKYPFLIEGVTERLDVLTNYSRGGIRALIGQQVNESYYMHRKSKLRVFVKNVVDTLIRAGVLTLSGDVVKLNIESIEEALGKLIDNLGDVIKSPYLVAITRRMLVTSMLSTYAEMTVEAIEKNVKDLAKVVDVWKSNEQIERDIDYILNEYIHYLHAKRYDDWIVWSSASHLSHFVVEAEQVGISRDIVKQFLKTFSGLRAISSGLLVRVIEGLDIELRKKVEFFNLFFNILKNVQKTGELIYFPQRDLLVDAYTYHAVRKFTDEVSTNLALDVVKKILDYIPIQLGNAEKVIEVIRNDVARLVEELGEKPYIAYDKFISSSENRDAIVVLLQILKDFNVLDYDVKNNAIIVKDLRVLKALSVFLGAKPITEVVC